MRVSDGRSSTSSDVAESVRSIAKSLGLEFRSEVSAGRRPWGATRTINTVLMDAGTKKSLGIECRSQSSREELTVTIEDIDAWPIPGLLVIDGPGFSANMKGYLYSTGKAVAVEDLEPWLRLYFGLPGD